MSLVYETSEDGGSFTLHLLGIMRIKILRDRYVRMTETGGHINGVCTGFDEPCRVCVPKTVRVQPVCR